MRVFLVFLACLIGILTAIPQAGTYLGGVIGYCVGVAAGGAVVYLTERGR